MVVLKGSVKYSLYCDLNQGIGNDVLEQSEETKLQCVVKTSADSSVINGVSYNGLNFC